MTDPCRHRCKHADCAMAKGDALPEIVTAAYQDGVLYEPLPGKQAIADASRDAIAHMRALEAIASVLESTTPPDTSSPDSAPDE